MWLVLAGGFSNVPALRLNLAYGFEIIGFYEVESQILMAIRNVGEESTRRALKQVKGKLESTFLLPVLRSATTMQPPIVWMASNNKVMQDSQGTEVSGANLFSQQSSVALGKATAESESQGTSSSSEPGIQMASSKETQKTNLRIQEFLTG